MNCRGTYSRYILQLQGISVAHESRSNYDQIHAGAMAYFYGNCNPQEQDNTDNTDRDQHLTSSVGVRGIDHDMEHRIHNSERVTHVNLSVYLDVVQVIRQHHVWLHPLSMVSNIPIDFVK